MGSLVVFVIIICYVIWLWWNKANHTNAITDDRNIQRNIEVNNDKPKLCAEEPKIISSDFHETGLTIWSGKAIKLSFTYKAKAQKALNRTVLVDRYFSSTGGGRYITGNCLLRNERRTFKTSNIRNKIFVEDINARVSISELQKGFREKDLMFGTRIEIARDTDSTTLFKLVDGEVFDIKPRVEASFKYHSSSKRKVITSITQVYKRSKRRFLSGIESNCSTSHEYRIDKILEPIIVQGKEHTRKEFVELIFEHIQQDTPIDIGLSKRNRLQQAKITCVDWEKEGLLSISGYRVGKSKGVKQHIRRQILLDLLQHDDLSDVTNVNYAKEWGAVNSHSRYQKLSNVLKSLLNTGKRKQENMNADYSVAIREWSSDLDFLKREFNGVKFKQTVIDRKNSSTPKVNNQNAKHSSPTVTVRCAASSFEQHKKFVHGWLKSGLTHDEIFKHLTSKNVQVTRDEYDASFRNVNSLT